MNEQANMAAHYEHEIPEGYEAKIEGNKVIFVPKESEDERIRKELINFFKVWKRSQENSLSGTSNWRGINTNRIITWLEKQKECVADTNKTSVSEDEKMLKERISNIDAICLSAEIQKPYKDGNQLCILKGDNIQEGVVGFGNTQEDALVDFIRNVPIEKQKEQKPAEWSEEDVINLTNTIRALQSLGMIQKADHRYDNLIDWLELLHERFDPSHHWKPSEGQMKALEAAFRKEGNDEYRRTINSLYQDLKKL